MSDMAILNDVVPTAPIVVERTLRYDRTRKITSSKAGVFIPVEAVPLLREDRASGIYELRFDMAETPKLLVNPVMVTAFAHFVPFSAFERFDGIEDFNRAYMGEPDKHGRVTPLFNVANVSMSGDIWKKLGLHTATASPTNTSYVEAYNCVWNYRARARSRFLTPRSEFNGYLAPAFWKHSDLGHVVADFDDAALDGVVDLEIIGGQAPVSGIGIAGGAGGISASANIASGRYYRRTGSAAMVGPTTTTYYGSTADTPVIEVDSENIPQIFAQMQSMGVKLSLQNIELAKKTAAFADLKARYSGIDDDFIIDLLMQGVRVPDAALNEPILVDKQTTLFGMTRRYATDGASLAKSATNGETVIELKIRLPQTNTGGILLISYEIVPEQFFERREDPFIRCLSADDLPNALRDTLDPQKVEIVRNRDVDVRHSNPDGIFGYVGLNDKWRRDFVRAGGRYLRPATDTFVEDRQIFWAATQTDPTLTEDFYLVRDLPHTVFADQVSDPFTVRVRGGVDIVGLTQFGKRLQEGSDEYQEVLDVVDQSRINP